MRTSGRGRVVLGLLSVAALVALYTFFASLWNRPDLLPPTRAVWAAFWSLVTGGHPAAPGEHVHHSDHVALLLEQEVTLQGALLVSAARVVFGVAVGGALGILVGAWMGWSRRVDEYLHPVYVLFRSIPPLALITYVMLWFGHGQTHLLVPIVYAVLATVVIPAYHGVRDVADIYVKAARALGARGRLLVARVLVPAASPTVLGGLRYALLVAWMTTVGVEMLMADDGIGHLIVGGGLWSSRLEVRADPAVVMVSIVALASAGSVMDAALRIVTGRLTAWTKGAGR
ncbi:MAG TPA: ABC transporter permease [Methylomirabilota bacterium]|nr:ABC transporter permease [Methylomirabilota bacterium]